jgi:RNA polymerase sigma-70 factor (ECF subfamily)
MKQNPDDIALDAKYIQLALQGDAQAFRWLVDKYHRYIFGLCWRVTGNEQDAADLTQETFLKLYTHLKDYRPGEKLSNWLYTIALNESRKNLRRKKIVRFFSLDQEEILPPLAAQGAESDGPARETQSKALFDRLVRDLPESLRPSFVLRYSEELSDEEIAQVTGLSLSNVRVRIHRARRYLWEKHAELIREIL